ncbi:MAG: hypothetical protein QOJ76_2264 [Acidobacteriota bacterium]|jgi:outer membrane protein assembly factor BamB|nr:hypothetical protein [Acidobacteriota bacterium]
MESCRRRRLKTERARRLACVTALLLLCQHLAPGQSPPAAAPKSPGAFQHAKRAGEDASATFEFETSGFSYHIAANGNGRRTRDDKTRRFNLRLEGGDYIETLYFSEYAGDLLLACGVTDGESGAGFVVRLEQPSMRARWKQHVPTFNPGEPLREGRYLYVTAVGFIAKLDLETGEYAWKHDGLNDTREGASKSFTTFDTPEIRGDTVLFKDGILFKDDAVYNRKTVAVDKKSGKIIRIE